MALIAYLKRKQGEGGARRAVAEDITVGEFAKDMFTEGQGIGVYFPIVTKLPEFEEFLTAKSKKSKKEGRKRGFAPELFRLR